METRSKPSKSVASKRSSGKKKAIIVVLTILFIALVGFLVYWFVLRETGECSQEDCINDIFCAPLDDRGLENIVVTVDFGEKLGEYAGITSDSLAIIDSGVSGFTKKSNLKSYEIGDWVGAWAVNNALKSDTEQQVKCGEVSAALQYITVDPTSGISVPEGSSYVQIIVRRVIPGGASNIIGYSEESKELICSSVDCLRSSVSVPKQGFEGDKCPQCQVFANPDP